jgi:thiamine kinase-like enzyme
MVLENARGDATDILPFAPELKETLWRTTETMKTCIPGQKARIPKATIHGSFKLAQLLYHEQQLALVDFDSIAGGDPLLDVAEMVASLAYLRISDGVSAESLRESIESLLEDYQGQVPWACDRRRLAWYVVAFLLGKIHASLKRLESSEVENIGTGFDLVQEWLDVAQR